MCPKNCLSLSSSPWNPGALLSQGSGIFVDITGAWFRFWEMGWIWVTAVFWVTIVGFIGCVWEISPKLTFRVVGSNSSGALAPLLFLGDAALLCWSRLASIRCCVGKAAVSLAREAIVEIEAERFEPDGLFLDEFWLVLDGGAFQYCPSPSEGGG